MNTKIKVKGEILNIDIITAKNIKGQVQNITKNLDKQRHKIQKIW